MNRTFALWQLPGGLPEWVGPGPDPFCTSYKPEQTYGRTQFRRLREDQLPVG